MPYLQFDLPEAYPAEAKRRLAERVGRVYAEVSLPHAPHRFDTALHAALRDELEQQIPWARAIELHLRFAPPRLPDPRPRSSGVAGQGADE